MSSLDSAALTVLARVGDAALRSTVPLVLAAIAASCLRRRSAALRHGIWTTALASALGLAALPSSLPPWPVLPRWAGPLAAPGDTATDPVTSRFVTQPPALPRARDVDEDRPSSPLDAEQVAVAFAVARAMTLRCRITFATSELIDVPLTWGLFSAHVALPAASHEWPTTTRQHVLRHELAHVERRDSVSQLIVHLAKALYWCHPLVWFAGREAQRECERACDDRVLALGASAPAYAADLLAFARQDEPAIGFLAASAMARRPHLERRLVALLDRRLERAPLSPFRRALLHASALLVVIPVAAASERTVVATMPVALTAAPSPRPSIVPLRQSAPADAAPRAAATQKPAPIHPLDDAFDALGGCARPTEIHDHANDELWQVDAREGACHVSMTARGHVQFTADDMAIASMAPGASFEIAVENNTQVTHLVVEPSPGGVLHDELTRNGVAAPSVDVRNWLAQALLVVDRETAFAVDRRVPALLSSGGPTPVLDEIDRLRSDHARMVYLQRLVDTTSLDAAALRRTANDVGPLGRDETKTRVLSDLVRTQRLGDARQSVEDAIATIVAPHDRERVEALLTRASRHPR